MKFKFIHKETGLTLRQYIRQNKLNCYIGQYKYQYDLKDDKVKYVLTEDESLAIQKLHPGYDEAELLFLSKLEWNVVYDN